MKYNIHINQQAIVEYNKEIKTKLNLIDAAVFDYLFWICSSPSDKVATKRLRINEEDYTWVDYNHLIEEMPILHYSKPHISRSIKKLEKAKLIKTTVKSFGKGQAKYVKILDSAERLVSDVLDEE